MGTRTDSESKIGIGQSMKQGILRKELWRYDSLNLFGDVIEHPLNTMEGESIKDPAMLIVATRNSLWRKGRTQKSWLHFCSILLPDKTSDGLKTALI